MTMQKMIRLLAIAAIGFVRGVGVLYLVGAFVSWNFHPGSWSWPGRLLVGILWLLDLMMIIGNLREECEDE